MRIKTIKGIMLTLLLIGMLIVTFNTAPTVADTGTDELSGGSSTIQDADGDNSSNPLDSQESFLKEGFDWNASAEENPKPWSVDENRWKFNMTNEWSDFAKVDDDSAELVIGVNNGKPNSYADIAGLIDEKGGDLVGTVSMGGEIRAVAADIPLVAVSSFVAEVRDAGLSKYIEPNMKFQACFVPNDPRWSLQWGPRMIEADYAWNTTLGDPSVLVAVIDTGIDWNHPDLAANYVPLGYDWVNDDTDPMDDDGHGTHCAGIIAAVIDNSVGIAGLAQAKIMAEKGLDEYGYGYEDDLANAIIHAVDQGANILSNSWGGYGESALIHEAVEYAYDHGVLVVAAAGNEATSMKLYPAGYDEVIAVTATDEYDNPAWFTNFGEWVEIAAPGVDIYSTVWDDAYTYMDGTSMSTPHVAGVAALILSQFPSMTRNQLRVQLRHTADDLGSSGFDPYYGYGRVNARRAVEEAPPDHDLLILDWERPPYVEPGDVATVGTTVFNFGVSNESHIEVHLSVNGSVVDNATIDFLASGKSAIVNCSWSPTVEEMYNVTSYVVPVPGETVTDNNIVWAYVCVGFPVRAVVLDSAGNYIADTITNWEVLNINWYLFGSQLIHIDYTTLSISDITYDDIAATGADVLIISCAYQWEFTNSEIDAIKRYVHEGHGLIATAGTLYYGVPNNNRLATLFGLKETVTWDATSTDLLHLQDPMHPLFVNVPNPYTFPQVGTALPSDGRWNGNELDEGTYVALGHYEESAIVVYRGLVYISPWLEIIPSYYHHHLQLLYNAITWSQYEKPEHELIVHLESPPALKTCTSTMLNATVSNMGLSNETNVELQLIINGTLTDSVVITELLNGSSYTLNCLWTPTVEATYNVTAYAPPLPDEESIENNVDSATVPVHYMLIALVKNVDPWDYSANEEALSLYSIPHVVFGSKDFGSIDLSPFSKVVIASDQDQNFYDAMDTYRWWFEDYVSNGGLLEIHAADWGWRGGGWVGPLPGGLEWVGYYSDYVTIVDPVHPVVTVPNPITDAELDYWYYSVHGYFGTYPTDSRVVIIEDSSGYPAYLEFEHGAGFIVASSQALELAYERRYSPILENSLLYFKFPHELAVFLEAPALLEPGDSSLLNATVYNMGMSNETDVGLQLLINGSIVDSVVIPELLTGSSYALSYLWTPTVEGAYNVTAYAPPVPGENVTANNRKSKFVEVSCWISIFVTEDNWPIPPDNDLDYYMYNDDPRHPIEWAHWYNLSSPVLEATLQIYVYDVDSPDEVNEVYFNGLYIGQLQGADGQWTLNNFTVPTSYVQNGINIVTVYVDVTHPSAGYWAMEVDWGNLIIHYATLEHELISSLEAPASLALGDSVLLNATVTNLGLNNETNVELQLLINGTIADFVVVPELLTNSFYTLSYVWTPTVEATYNITTYVPPVPDETFTENNVETKTVSVVPMRDVAIISVTTSDSQVYEGQIVNVTVVAKNEGKVTETFDVTACYDTSVIGAQTVTNLTVGANVTLTFSWDTTGVEPRLVSYTINAVATLVPGEIDTADNTYVDGGVKVKMVGDVNGDGKVTITDVTIAAIAFGSRLGDPNWNPNADLNQDGKVNIVDLVIIGVNFGKKLPLRGHPAQATWVEPDLVKGVPICDTFVVDIMINITDPPGAAMGLFGFEYKLFWNMSILQCERIQYHSPWPIPPAFLVINETGMWSGGPYDGCGYHWLAIAAMWNQTPFTGVTSLCTYTFHVVGNGSCALDLYDTEFTDDTATIIISDTLGIGTTVDGYFTNVV